jgi:hypothetical protein
MSRVNSNSPCGVRLRSREPYVTIRFSPERSANGSTWPPATRIRKAAGCAGSMVVQYAYLSSVEVQPEYGPAARSDQACVLNSYRKPSSHRLLWLPMCLERPSTDYSCHYSAECPARCATVLSVSSLNLIYRLVQVGRSRRNSSGDHRFPALQTNFLVDPGVNSVRLCCPTCSQEHL